MTARAKRVTSLQLSIVVLAALAAAGVAGQTRQTPNTDFGSVLKWRLLISARFTQTQSRLQSLLARYEATDSETVLRFCLDPSYARLRNEIAMTVSAIERLRASGAEAQANIEMQNGLQQQQRTFTTLSNIMKTKHDTAKNSISNVR